MTEYVTVWSKQPTTNSIKILSINNSYVVTLLREDLTQLGNIKQSRQPGIYILRNSVDGRIYVGQSNAIMDRLNRHNREKDWWDNVIFFGSDAPLDKAQLDYLERMLIQLFKKHNFTLENGPAGNTSPIHEFLESKADSLWGDVEYLLDNNSKIDLFGHDSVNNSKISFTPQIEVNDNTVDIVDMPFNSFRFSDSLGTAVTNSYAIRAFSDWVIELCKNEEYLNSLRKFSDNANFGIVFSKAGDANKTVYLADDLYLNISMNDVQKILFKVVRISSILKIDAVVHKRELDDSFIIYDRHTDFRSRRLMTSD